MKNNIPSFLLRPSVPVKTDKGRVRNSFVEGGLKRAAGIITESYMQWETASSNGLMQGLDARVKIFFMLLFIFVISLKREISGEAAVGVFIFLLAASTKIHFFDFCRRVLFFGFLFGFLIALPSALNIIKQGDIIVPLITLPKSYTVWIYHIPERIGFTMEGLRGVALLTLRVVDSLAVSLLVLYTTPFQEIVKALRVLRVPDVILVTITLAYKYIFIFATTVEEMFKAKKGRLAREESGAEAREWVVGRMAFIFRKTQIRCEEVYKAMLSRGLGSDVKLHQAGQLRLTDRLAACGFAITGMLFLVL